ncbi:unnamed protein product [Rotaria sp. Silwood2]|nr:unnamed protein product [Rotaria sp. Silwood2]CAF4255768.1 unnamed protein product [Rotaria sp. Silwood2]
MTYTRIFGRGYTLDDPDMISCLAMVANAIMYLVYNIQLNVSPEHYETNMLYKYADIIEFVDACFCVFACLRDDDWFWFLPLAGQYGIALGRVQVETKTLPQFGKAPILLTSEQDKVPQQVIAIAILYSTRFYARYLLKSINKLLLCSICLFLAVMQLQQFIKIM